MSDYREALKSLSKEERIVVKHLEDLIGDLKAVRMHTVFKGQEAVIAAAIEKEVMAHLMSTFTEEVAKERSKIDLLLNQVNSQASLLQKERSAIERELKEMAEYREIFKHIKALSTEGKVKLMWDEKGQ